MVVQRDGGRLSVRLLRGSDGSTLPLEEKKTAVNPIASGQLGVSPRESEVLDWVCKGKTNREIGEILGVSSRTVQKHLEHVFQKIGVETRTAAALWFHQARRGFPRARD